MVARLAGKFDGLDSFGDAADLVQLDENGVGDAFLDAAGQALGARDEEVVADKLDFLFGGLAAEALGQGFPAGPVVLGHAILDRSEEHTSELQSQSNLVCRLLLEKKKDHF